MTVQKMQRMKISGNSEFHVLSDHWSKSSKNRFQFEIKNLWMVGENLNWSCEELAFVMTLGNQLK